MHAGGDHDRVHEALLEGLRRALAEPAAQRLFASGKLPGLFPARGRAAEAAREAVRAGLLEVVRTEARGNAQVEWVRVTPQGVDFLHEHESPVRSLHELKGALRGNQQAVPLWLADMREGLRALDGRLAEDARRWLGRLEALERRVDEALRRLEAAAPLVPPELTEDYPWAVDALNYLDRRRTGGAPDDCPLPELFAAVGRHHPSLSVGTFHDGLRRLHQRRALVLKPAAGAAELAQPEYALLDEARVYYYASR